METLSQWKIYVGAFFDRFGDEKLNILASADPIIQAAIKDCSVRQYIDLDGRKAEMQALLQYIASKGFSLDINAILNLEPSKEEIWNGENYVPPVEVETPVVNKLAGTVYKVSSGYVTCTAEELAPDAYEQAWPVTSEFLNLVAAGAEITERDGQLWILGRV